jgi:hypothetical protein
VSIRRTWRPSNCQRGRRWVDAKDELAISLLQARLIDLKLSIRISEGI